MELLDRVMCENCDRDDDKREKDEIEQFLNWGYLAGILILVWGGFAALQIFRSPESSAAIGQFGDAFGMINAIFSSITAAGAVYAVMLQGRELRLARIEARNAREEARRSADAQTGLVKLQASNLVLQEFIQMEAAQQELLEDLEKRKRRLFLDLQNPLEITNRLQINRNIDRYTERIREEEDVSKENQMRIAKLKEAIRALVSETLVD